MVVYLDPSAIIKRVVDEVHSAEMTDWLSAAEQAGDELITSTLGWIEVSRALKRRLGGGDGAGSDLPSDLDAQALSGVSGFPISYEIVSLAWRIGPAQLRTLDAIHCATAALIDADAFVSYDDRQIESARELSLSVVSPGRGAVK